MMDEHNDMTHIWSFPGVSNVTVGLKKLQAFLLFTGGEVLARGRLWDVDSKHIGGGIYRVSLKERNDG